MRPSMKLFFFLSSFLFFVFSLSSLLFPLSSGDLLPRTLRIDPLVLWFRPRQGLVAALLLQNDLPCDRCVHYKYLLMAV